MYLPFPQTSASPNGLVHNKAGGLKPSLCRVLRDPQGLINVIRGTWILSFFSYGPLLWARLDSGGVSSMGPYFVYGI